jgi:hypothetical protein
MRAIYDFFGAECRACTATAIAAPHPGTPKTSCRFSPFVQKTINRQLPDDPPELPRDTPQMW